MWREAEAWTVHGDQHNKIYNYFLIYIQVW